MTALRVGTFSPPVVLDVAASAGELEALIGLRTTWMPGPPGDGDTLAALVAEDLAEVGGRLGDEVLPQRRGTGRPSEPARRTPGRCRCA